MPPVAFRHGSATGGATVAIARQAGAGDTGRPLRANLAHVRDVDVPEGEYLRAEPRSAREQFLVAASGA